jgi:hypothetical protein
MVVEFDAPLHRIAPLTTPLGGFSMATKRKKLSATVQKIIKSPIPSEPEKAEIAIHDADDLYREIRIENTVVNESGEKAKLKEGAKVDVIVEADSSATTKKPA